MKLLHLLVLVCVSQAAAFPRLEPRPPRITVRVLNPAGVPSRTISRAEEIAGLIFRGAGLDVEWLDCESSRACRTEPGPMEFWLHLLAKRPPMFSRDALGFSLLTHEPNNEGGYAAVSWQAIRRLSDAIDEDIEPILGAAMAHELGHLLLGSHSHARDGVMAPRLKPSQLQSATHGTLWFTGREAAAIRDEIRRRVAGK